MAVMIAVRDETNETIENIIKKRLESDGVKEYEDELFHNNHFSFY